MEKNNAQGPRNEIWWKGVFLSNLCDFWEKNSSGCDWQVLFFISEKFWRFFLTFSYPGLNSFVNTGHSFSNKKELDWIYAAETNHNQTKPNEIFDIVLCFKGLQWRDCAVPYKHNTSYSIVSLWFAGLCAMVSMLWPKLGHSSVIHWTVCSGFNALTQIGS